MLSRTKTRQSPQEGKGLPFAPRVPSHHLAFKPLQEQCGSTGVQVDSMQECGRGAHQLRVSGIVAIKHEPADIRMPVMFPCGSGAQAGCWIIIIART